MGKPASFHQELITTLRKLLRSRRFLPGSQFLTEREIAKRFKTTRPTANKALSNLVSLGLLEFRQGAGTFVRESVLDYDLQRLVSFTDKAEAAGKVPSTRVLVFKKMTASEAAGEIAQALRLTPNEQLFYMERLRLADGQAVIYECRHIAARLCPAMNKTNAKGSLYAFWTTRCKLTLSGAEESIRAVNATQSQAIQLGIAVRAACLQVIATGFLEGGIPLWHEETLYRSDVYEFRNQLGGVSSPKPAQGRIRSAER